MERGRIKVLESYRFVKLKFNQGKNKKVFYVKICERYLKLWNIKRKYLITRYSSKTSIDKKR
jgi:hypothetical protein